MPDSFCKQKQATRWEADQSAAMFSSTKGEIWRALTIVTLKSAGPARTSIGNVLNSLSLMVSSLLTIVLAALTLLSRTLAMTYLYGR